MYIVNVSCNNRSNTNTSCLLSKCLVTSAVTSIRQVYCPGNVAYHKTAFQAVRSQWARRWPANKAVDGDTDTDINRGHCAHPESVWGARAWWMVDLVDTYNISKVTIYNRADDGENDCWDTIYLHNIVNNEITSNTILEIDLYKKSSLTRAQFDTFKAISEYVTNMASTNCERT